MTRISPLAFVVAELFLSAVEPGSWAAVGFCGSSLVSEGAEEGCVEVEEAEVVLDVVGLSSNLNLELAAEETGLMRTGEKVLRKST